MEVAEYAYPESWDDGGMDWSNPDPGRADYAMALRQAVLERAAAAHVPVGRGVLDVSPWRTVSAKALAEIASAICALAPNFVDMEFDGYAEDLSDYPRMWTYADLVRADGCEVFSRAWSGLPCRGGGAWLRAMRNALDRLTVIPCNTLRGQEVSRSGSEHDPPFGESIGNAMDQAMKAEPRRWSGRLPLDVKGWSGNTHWCCPRKDDPDSKNGYCGYAESRAYRVSSIDNWLRGRAFNLLLAARAEPPSGPVQFSTVLDAAVFDSSGTGLEEGVSFLDPVRVEDAGDLKLALGDPDSIPRNSNAPTSEFDEDGNAVTRHSTKIGYSARIWGLMDYGVEGGFRFRGKG